MLIEGDSFQMISLRYIRRKALSFLLKSVVVCSVFLVLIQLTSSHPRGSNFKPEIEVVQVGNVENAESLKEPGQSQNLELKSTQHKPIILPAKAKQDRSGQFYENVIVHFDLKGAPPKVPYFKELLKLVKDSGATGILLEWEDMFPWEGQLKNARNTDAYSVDDAKAILNEAQKLNLDIIPLVQTFGHLEWFLKLEQFQNYRENPEYPQVLCLGDQEGVDLVKDAIRQIVEFHKPYGIPYFHIGADEAFEFGVCQKSLEWISSHGGQQTEGKQLLALTHLKNIALFAREQIGDDVTILAWHDMLKDFDGQLIKRLQLGTILQPVVWDYSENIVTMPDVSFSVIAENFPIIWASSAYKGANFPSAKYIDILHYERNNMEWIRTKQRQAQKFKKFGGIIITGWQRYDHMAAICEILPMGTPSMVLQIRTALNAPNIDQEKNRNEAAKILGCSSYSVNGLGMISTNCKFPGWGVYQAFQGNAQQVTKMVEDELAKNHHVLGWLSPYSMKKNFTQNWYLKSIDGFLNQQLHQLKNVENGIRTEMQKLFFENTIDEFLFITVGQLTDKIRIWLNECRRLAKLRTYPSRHFPIERVKEL